MKQIKLILLATLALAALSAVLPAHQMFADGSDPMPLCRGKNCPPPGK